MRTLRLLSALALILILSACGGRTIKPYKGPESALVYGNITLPDRVIKHVILYEYGKVYVPPFSPPPQAHVYTNGNFFFENLKPGKYYLSRFVSGRDVFLFPYRNKEQVDRASRIVKPGALKYFGSYKVGGVKGSILGSGSFNIEAGDTPSPREILQHLQKVTAGTGWDRRIAEELNALQQ